MLGAKSKKLQPLLIVISCNLAISCLDNLNALWHNGKKGLKTRIINKAAVYDL